MQIDEENKVAYLKMGDGTETWLPVGYIHKFVTLRQHREEEERKQKSESEEPTPEFEP